MIIEFTGLPGSGKSTLCGSIEPWLEGKGYKVVNWLYHASSWGKLHRIAHKLKVSLKFLFTHPILFRELSSIVFKSKQNDFKSMIAQLLNLIYISALYWRYNQPRFSDRVVLFDQGKIQALTSLIFQSGVKDLQSLLPGPIREMYANEFVIQIDVPPEELLIRLENRAGTQSRVERMEPKERLGALVQFRETGDRVLENKYLYNKLFRINGSELGKEQILEEIKNLFQDHFPQR